MRRIVNGILFEGKLSDTHLEVTVWEGNGHREVSARPAVDWVEAEEPPRIGPPGMYVLDAHERELEAAQLERDAEERREAARLRNARRAKTACRRFIKVMGFDELLTLTYRENVTDEAKVKDDARRFFRRMAELIPDFGYCAGYEPQARGSWHVHAAVYGLPKEVAVKKRAADGTWRVVKLPGWRVGTAVWRSIVGKDNGLCFVGGKGARAKSARRSLAKMAGYVSKYITKHYELVPDGQQRWTHSKGEQVPKSAQLRLRMSLREFIAFAMARTSDNDSVVDARLGKFRDSYYLCTEDPSKNDGTLDISRIALCPVDATHIADKMNGDGVGHLTVNTRPVGNRR
ncbi:hypothetical protein [uncultured Pseudacidovorax sp.]|uniref:rolling circle replication-associated protein n=1 Tax=uncultured Pseudacidovorax sp. TaxID=679313 RepID=UPI0025D80D7B|nr:hypothetical protein [uncultured Pseudacidovorax sp.]